MKITPIHLLRLQPLICTQALCDKLNEIAEAIDTTDIYSSLLPDQLRIIKAVESVTGYSYLLMLSKSMAVPLSEAKFIAQHELYELGYTTYEIASIFKLTYHGVYNGLQRYKDLQKRRHFTKKADGVKELLKTRV